MRLNERPTEAEALENFMCILPVRHASFMWAMQDLIGHTSEIIAERFDDCRSICRFAQMCVLLFRQILGQDEAVARLVARFDEAVKDSESWKILKEKALLKEVDKVRKAEN